MQENTNKAIVYNTAINYLKTGITTVLALFTTRFALQALGVNDFGLFSVLGSIISFIGIFNTIMLSTSNRFLAVAIGKGDIGYINKQFNVNMVIFIGISILMALIAYPLGSWYVHRYLNYDGTLNNAMMVFCISIVGSIISTLATPFNGLLMAKERFIVFCSVEVFCYFLRFIVAYILVFYFDNKLLLYTVMMAATAALPFFVYWAYCRHYLQDYVKWNLVRDGNMYKNVFAFSGWVGFGAIAVVCKNQGASLLVNTFFNTVMNTALGLAHSLNSFVSIFANNLTQPIQPQLTKSYAAGDFKRADELLAISTKLSFMLMLLVGCPFFVSSDWILKIWLGDIPAYASAFTLLMIIDNIVQSFNSGISTILFASGKIKRYQVLINLLRLLSILVAYFVLKSSSNPYSLFYTYIFFSLLTVIATQWCLRKTLNYDMQNLFVKAYIPSLLILVLFLPSLMLPVRFHPLIRVFLYLFYLLTLELYIGFKKDERLFLFSKLLNSNWFKWKNNMADS